MSVVPGQDRQEHVTNQQITRAQRVENVVSRRHIVVPPEMGHRVDDLSGEVIEGPTISQRGKLAVLIAGAGKLIFE